jgi:hypothetical protein
MRTAGLLELDHELERCRRRVGGRWSSSTSTWSD